MVPEVGGSAITEVQGSIDAMRRFTERIVAARAETVVIISPHAPLEARAFVAYAGPELRGDFANFRAPQAIVRAPLDTELLDAIAGAAAEDGYPLFSIKDFTLDHGTAVPLYFLQRNGWRGDVVAIGYSFLPDADHLRFGACIRRAIERTQRRVACVASGDLSHRLKPDAPAGYYPNAYRFDDLVTRGLSECSFESIIDIDQDLRRMAGECGYRSMLVAFGVAEGLPPNCEVLHYEAPFGVGYMVAQLWAHPAGAMTTETEKEIAQQKAVPQASNSAGKHHGPASEAEEITSLARQAVEIFIRERHIIEPPPMIQSPTLREKAACFVSLKIHGDELRGCIGTTEPVAPTLAEELIANAISAATHDPRFPPLAVAELNHLRYSVDVLSPPEPAQFEDLDPTTYGVIVEDESGARRGLLLPAIAGVETARQQVEIAARKAGINPDASIRLQRFRVRRFRAPLHGDETP